MLLRMMTVVGVVIALSACGASLIKPADKHVEAMVQFDMPDYEHSVIRVKQKVEKWMLSENEPDDSVVTYVATTDTSVTGRGVMTFVVRGDDLSIKYNITVEIISPKLVKLATDGFVDLPGDRQGESDRSYVFHNQVKDRIFKVADSLEDYLNEDTKKELIIDVSI